MSRLAALVLLAVGSLGLAIGGGALEAPGAAALGWAAADGTFLLLMLGGGALRPMGVLLGLLGVGGALLAVPAGGWALVLAVPAVVLAGGGLATAKWGPGWPRRAGSGPRVAPDDHWKQFDAGEDPTRTGPEDVADESDPR